MSNNSYDVIVIGAGSVGVPVALYLAEMKHKVLVIDQLSSSGQGQNKKAIGGVRAAHSDPAKVAAAVASRNILSAWEDNYGDDIEWKYGGYCYPVFTEQDKKTFLDILPVHASVGVKTDWVDADTICDLIPGINQEGLLGGLYSPDDGQASPLLATSAMQRQAEKNGADFVFNEVVVDFKIESNKITQVITDKNKYSSKIVVNAAGAKAREIGALMGLDIPVFADSHEGGITSPVKHFLRPLVVDSRKGPEGKTANFYFGQNKQGQIIFCYTPIKPVVGEDTRSTSDFLPVVAKRMVSLIPSFKNLLVRRTWRGLYPMTPSGIPIVDKVKELEGVYLAVGMCGQGFMLGPGIGQNLAHFIDSGKPCISEDLFKQFSVYKDPSKSHKEVLS